MGLQRFSRWVRGALTLRRRQSILVAAFLLSWAPLQGAVGQGAGQAADQAVTPAPGFDLWLDALRREALARGVSARVLDRAFQDAAPIEKVLFYDRRQPEFTQTLWSYFERTISEARIERGARLLREHAALFAEVERKYGVQPRFLVAFWGLESNYGDFTGGFPVTGALATLAHDPRRSDFFRAELFYALGILEAGHIEFDRMQGSWAGAMGQTQFMPSTFAAYAVDGDGDGKIDIWGSLPDIFHSAANYLSKIGWNGEKTWGREVLLPADFDAGQAQLSIRRSLDDWAAMGVTRVDGSRLPRVDIDGSIVLPAGIKGPAFLVYDNFRAIMTWNRSILYALSVGHLSDRIVGRGPLAAQKPAGDRPLSRDDVLALQTALNRLGFDAGAPDGIAGSKTRAAVRAFQAGAGLPQDGYADSALVAAVTERAGRL
ncbi:MAG: lytic murein transglycosylase [Alphaproteobacteria bacterium]|nr:lytic murein transglycosylase [Alphaproteobacteria bacterium]